MSDKIVEILLVVVVTLIVGCVFFVGYKIFASDGKIDYCYVDNIAGNSGGYEVVGHRPWKPNAYLGVAESGARANEIMRDSVSCPK